jgi:hypothetical protein
MSLRDLMLPRAWPLRASSRVDELAAEALPELLGVRAISKTEDVHVRAVTAEGMSARAEREAFAEKVHGHVIAPAAPRGRQRDLVRPVAVNGVFAELAFAIDHAATKQVGRRPLALLAGRGEPSVRACCGRRDGVAEVEQKGNFVKKK